MSRCQCYQIGGPFIAEDPDCPQHGYEAQREERSRHAYLKGIRVEAEVATDVESLRRVVMNLIDYFDR